MATENTLTIYATEALEEVFPALEAAFRAAGGCPLQTVFGHTGALRLELEGNMACDVFLASDAAAPKALEQVGRAKKVFRYARNAMIVVTREERRFRKSDWSDILCDPSLAIGMSTPGNSPEGDWARALFAATAKALPAKTGSRVISQHAVPLIAGQHSGEDLRGESGAHFMLRHTVDAAVAYASRAAKIRSEGLVVYPVPAEVGPEVTFCGCFPRTGKGDPEQAKRFVDLLLSEEGQRILEGAGFLRA